MTIFRRLTIPVYAFLIGGLFAIFGIWPMPQIERAVMYYLDHDRWIALSPTEVLYSDLGLYPYRQLAQVGYDPGAEGELRDLDLPGRRDRRSNPKIFVGDTEEWKPLRLVAGLLDTEQGLLGALLVGPGGTVLHHWPLSAEVISPDSGGPIGGSLRDIQTMIHGLEVLPDGSIIAAFYKSPTLTRFDSCGNPVWTSDVAAHHSVVADDTGHIWTWDGQDMVRLRLSDGQEDKRIRMVDLAARAPGKYILSARRFFDAEDGTRFKGDAFHPNDIDPLPAALADAFPMFAPGFLLVSLRTGGLLMVVDPETGEIVWWMQDGAFAQHDPDWQPDGTITVLDNNTDFGPSRIIRIFPGNKSYEIVLDGAGLNLYTDLMGNYEILEDGGVIVNASRQGRVLELSASGERRFEFFNLYDPNSGRAGVVGEARVLPFDFFDEPLRCEER